MLVRRYPLCLSAMSVLHVIQGRIDAYSQTNNIVYAGLYKLTVLQRNSANDYPFPAALSFPSVPLHHGELQRISFSMFSLILLYFSPFAAS